MSDTTPPRLGRRGRMTLAAIGVGIVAVFVAANAHLVYVSIASQPACVPHMKAPDESGATLRAAKSSC